MPCGSVFFKAIGMNAIRQKSKITNPPLPSQDPPLFVVAYDIGDNRQRQKMFKLLRGYGTALQESLFLCRLTHTKQAALSRELQAFTLEASDRLHGFRIGHDGVVLIHGKTNEPNWIEE